MMYYIFILPDIGQVKDSIGIPKIKVYFEYKRTYKACAKLPDICIAVHTEIACKNDCYVHRYRVVFLYYILKYQ